MRKGRRGTKVKKVRKIVVNKLVAIMRQGIPSSIAVDHLFHEEDILVTPEENNAAWDIVAGDYGLVKMEDKK